MDNTLSTWGSVKVGDTLIIKDEKTIQEAIEAHLKGAVDGLSARISDIIQVVEKNNTCEWKIMKAVAASRVFYILVKKVGELFDVRVYQENGWMAQGTRGDLVNNKNFFLFCEPKGDWTPKDLEMAVSFSLNVDGKQVGYDQKNPSFYGTASVKSATQNDNGLFASVTEYSTDSKVDDNEILVYELGGLKNGKMQDVGGWVTFLEGYNIRNEEIDILPN